MTRNSLRVSRAAGSGSTEPAFDLTTSLREPTMHPWHDIPIDEERIADEFPAVIEVPKGSVNKYELDKATGMLRLDRVLHSAVFYPADYGFIPRTLSEDGDALDVLAIGQEPVHPLTIVRARAIGMFRMEDEAGSDEKIVAVSLGDPAWNHITHHEQLPPFVVRQILRFFRDYKILENKQVTVDDIRDPSDALETIRAAMVRYDQNFDVPNQ